MSLLLSSESMPGGLAESAFINSFIKEETSYATLYLVIEDRPSKLTVELVDEPIGGKTFKNVKILEV